MNPHSSTPEMMDNWYRQKDMIGYAMVGLILFSAVLIMTKKRGR